ncbi:nuclear transport factor 2 family protein [Nocardia sp. NBC_01327]|uniref:nuclear transport factor 2 family protein n=1 Tax=Nocardia sp. NBC_01327 TaxID=2903593 RepID=UPI002E0DB5E0|nr:nuclear transport factor 2 family protein [Nocardia sp. NBC_01327]
MSAIENKQFIHGIFEQLAQGNTRALGDALAEDCRWTFPGAWSWAGTWQPRSEVLSGLLRPIMAQFDGGYRFETDFLLADGDRVVVQARGYGVTAHGPYHQTYCFVFRLAGGRITEVIEHCDTALVERVLQPVTPAR